MKIVLAEKVSPATLAVFAAEPGWEVLTHDQLPDGLAAALADADALVVRSAVQARSLQHEVNRIELDLRNSPDAMRVRRGQRLNEARALFDFERIVRAPGSPLDAVCEIAARSMSG